MAPGFDFASSFFLRCLYENEAGDPESPDVGFLKGPLLVRVGDLTKCLQYIYLHSRNSFRHIVSFLHLRRPLGMRMMPQRQHLDGVM
jgi:hypothetical protein